MSGRAGAVPVGSAGAMPAVLGSADAVSEIRGQAPGKRRKALPWDMAVLCTAFCLGVFGCSAAYSAGVACSQEEGDAACREGGEQKEFLREAESWLEKCSAGGSELACTYGVASAGKAIETDPTAYQARRGVEVLWQHREAIAASGQPVDSVLLPLYEKLKGTELAGHLLFYSAQWLKETGAGRNGPSAFYLLLLLADYHSDSPLWDDAVVLAADMLAEWGMVEDEIRLVEEALVPRPRRGYGALSDDFSQQLRYRLALLYEKRERYDEALRQLELVVNYHSVESQKDDALWAAARIYRVSGDPESSIQTLRFLLEACPWSRHADEARTLLVP